LSWNILHHSLFRLFGDHACFHIETESLDRIGLSDRFINSQCLPYMGFETRAKLLKHVDKGGLRQ